MGLFTKFFSREGEGPKNSQDDDAEPQSGDPADAAKPEEVVANKPDANDPRERTASPSPEAQRAAPSPPPAVVVQPSVALGKPPAAGAAAKPSGAARPASTPKREAVAAPRAPSALGTTQLSHGKPAAPPPLDKKSALNPQTQRNQPRKPTTTQHTRADATTMPLGTDELVKLPHPSAPLLAEAAIAGRTPLPLEAAVDAALAALTDVPHGRDEEEIERDRESDRRAVAGTFAELAKVHAEPLRELMFQLSLGRTPGAWATACRPVLRALLDAASQIELLELVGALGAFDAALERAAAEQSAFIGDAASETLKAAYERLRQQLPDAFAPPPQSDNRRLLVLETLLLQIPALQRRTLERLYAAGLSSLGQLGRARPEELSAVAGLEPELASAIVERVQSFERERSRIQPNAQRKHLQDKLRVVIDRLAQLQSDFERAEQEASNHRKRAARRGREAAVLELDLLFAELGEIDFIEELKRCAVRRKIERVASYLEEQQASA
jgi:hypothetical protein